MELRRRPMHSRLGAPDRRYAGRGLATQRLRLANGPRSRISGSPPPHHPPYDTIQALDDAILYRPKGYIYSRCGTSTRTALLERALTEYQRKESSSSRSAELPAVERELGHHGQARYRGGRGDLFGSERDGLHLGPDRDSGTDGDGEESV